MKLVELVLYTTFASIAIQLLTGLFGVYGLTKDVPPEHEALKLSLGLEMLVQAIELAFYVWLVARFHLLSMASTRYLDWVFSTPIMLFSLMLYFKYEQYRERGMDSTLVWNDLIENNKASIAIVLAANTMMLLLGYLGEIGSITKMNATFWGFAAFATAFYQMYANFASKSIVGTRLFSIVATIWGLYGIVYLFPPAQQNISLNALDIVAKNMFGVYLAYKVVSI